MAPRIPSLDLYDSSSLEGSWYRCEIGGAEVEGGGVVIGGAVVVGRVVLVIGGD